MVHLNYFHRFRFIHSLFDKLHSCVINSEISFNIYVPVMQKNQIFTKTILVAKKEIKKETYEMFLLSIQIRRNSKIK